MLAKTYFFNIKGDDFSFEIRRGTKSLCGRVCLSNGSFIIDNCSFNLVEFREELNFIIATIQDEKRR